MDGYRGILAGGERSNPDAGDDEGCSEEADCAYSEPLPAGIGQDERRMHMRAYHLWASLPGLDGLPRIADLTAASMAEFADHAVVLDFSEGAANPLVAMLGAKLAAECGAAQGIQWLSDVPCPSLLACITGHYTAILADRSPIGFEAEFTDQRGKTLVHRGILLPFSGGGHAVQQVLGVINWKEVADPVTTTALMHELESVIALASSWSGTPLDERTM